MDLDIDGLRVMVTAGAEGIGLEIARAFVREGARVHVCDVDEKALERLARTDPAITWTACDVAVSPWTSPGSSTACAWPRRIYASRATPAS